jgi:nuclear transport factor 2 (NTF2) superfamily protein
MSRIPTPTVTTIVVPFKGKADGDAGFDENGLMRPRIASINDTPINESDRKNHWPLGRRPDDHPSLSDLGL